VLAIIITIMVLELKVPEGHDLSDLVHTTGVGLLTYLLSFVYVGIYWNNHHHMFHLVRQVSLPSPRADGPRAVATRRLSPARRSR
jgi:TMEM175 potassium channel family protein